MLRPTASQMSRAMKFLSTSCQNRATAKGHASNVPDPLAAAFCLARGITARTAWQLYAFNYDVTATISGHDHRYDTKVSLIEKSGGRLDC